MADVDMTDAPSASGSGSARKIVGKKAGPGEGGADGKKRFEVKKVGDQTVVRTRVFDTNISIQWNAVALWAWDIVVDNCAICRNHIMDLCIRSSILKLPDGL